MVRQPAAAEATRYARRVGSLGLGLHFEAWEWEYRDGDWHIHHPFVPVDDARAG